MNVTANIFHDSLTTNPATDWSPARSTNHDPVIGDKYSTWSLKAGGRYVWFDNPLTLDAFCYLSAQPECQDITECPEDLACLALLDLSSVFSIGVRNFRGDECLYAVHRSVDLTTNSRGQRRPAQWDTVQALSLANNKRCAFVTDTQLAEHNLLINNWKRMMSWVRTAERDPDEALQCEILAIASHPEGLRIDAIASFFDDVPKGDVIAQVYWLIHQGTLDADIHNRRIRSSSFVRRATVH